jgi:hypothetical protein
MPFLCGLCGRRRHPTVPCPICGLEFCDNCKNPTVAGICIRCQPLNITADRQTACPNDTVTFRPQVTPKVAISWSGDGNPTTGIGSSFTTRFAAAGDHIVQATLTGQGGSQTASRRVHINEASGAAWVRRFPGSKDIADLVVPFRHNLERFIAAMQNVPIPYRRPTVEITATLRPPERAYLMHYAWLIARGHASKNIPPLVPTLTNPPAMEGVDICWIHRHANGDPDPTASREAAEKMVADFNMADFAALKSRHTEGRAIDMTISWTGSLTLTDGAGNSISITTGPRTGQNTELQGVAATYGVLKGPITDEPHWSDDGH